MISHALKQGVEGQAGLLARIEPRGRQKDQTQSAVVRDVGMGGEYVNPVEERGATGEFLENLPEFSAHLILVFEALLPLFHLAP